MALTEQNPHSGGLRGAHLVEGSHDTRRLYHSRAARDDRAGAFPLQEVTSGMKSRCAPFKRAPPRSMQAGWNRGTFFRASPLTNQG